MGKTTIEWTDQTWNPTTGCTKVSPGCDHCYAKTLHERFNGPDSFETVTLHEDRLFLPMHWRKPRRVFVNSMSDLFHADIPGEFIARVFATMAMTPAHTYQILTKRHARMRYLLNSEAFQNEVRGALMDLAAYCPRWEPFWPLPNVWLGVSVEDQHWADIRIPPLLDTPAAVRFLSCEPLLGPIDLAGFACQYCGHYHQRGELCLNVNRHLDCDCPGGGLGIDWVICGGESGRGARPMDPDWALSLRDQCNADGVPFLFKQWGQWVTEMQSPEDITLPGESWYLLGDKAPSFYKVGKKAAGRELDGRTWDEYPAVAS